MLTAQVKKVSPLPLDNLEDYLLQIIVLPEHRTLKAIKLTYYNFIECINELLHLYTKSKNNISLNVFITDYYVRKFEKSSDLYRSFFGLTQSWKRFIDS
jgi:hypothetical protein